MRRYATRRRRVKTDKRDARTLAEALRLGAYRVAHRVSAERRHVRAELAVREALVRTRTRYIALAKALVRRDGLRVAASESHLVAQRIAALELSETLTAELLPLFTVLAPINEQIAAADRRITAFTASDATVALLTTAPSIGGITASAIVATVDDITRFGSAHQFEAFLGLVPGERSSGEKRRIGRITKTGNARVRYLLVEAGWRILRSKGEDTAALPSGLGHCASLNVAGSGSRWSPWPADSRASSTRCGGTIARLMRALSGCRGSKPFRSRGSVWESR
jgi:transposase